MKKIILMLIVLVLSFFLTSCASTTRYIDMTCLLIKPITISSKDKLVDETLRQIYLQNILLESKCNKKNN